MYLKKSFYIIGGWETRSSSEITRLDSTSFTWSSAGHLNYARIGHSVSFVDSKMIVVGGVGNLKTEICELDKSQFICHSQDSSLDKYVYTPLVFIVNDQYKNC